MAPSFFAQSTNLIMRRKVTQKGSEVGGGLDWTPRREGDNNESYARG